MLFIPKTSPNCYVSGIVALNVRSPEKTGDWHSGSAFKDNALPQDRYIYGLGQQLNTHHLLGDMGIIDGTARLNAMGYFPENVPVWIADHPRACVDYLYTAVLKTGIVGRVILDEWFPNEKDKLSVYQLIDKMETHLTEQERKILRLWKRRNLLE